MSHYLGLILGFLMVSCTSHNSDCDMDDVHAEIMKMSVESNLLEEIPIEISNFLSFRRNDTIFISRYYLFCDLENGDSTWTVYPPLSGGL